jgi:hypothetical protein
MVDPGRLASLFSICLSLVQIVGLSSFPFFGLSSDYRIIGWSRVLIVAKSTSPHFEGMIPMQVSTDTGRRRFLGVLMSGGSFLAWSIAGCGTSESKVEITADAKKAIMANKIGDPSKFVKPGRGRGGRR